IETPFSCRIRVLSAWKSDHVCGETRSAIMERSRVSFRGKLRTPDIHILLKKVRCKLGICMILLLSSRETSQSGPPTRGNRPESALISNLSPRFLEHDL